MAKPALGSPFRESHLGDELRAGPLHLRHLIGGDASTPAARAGIRQIIEGTVRCMQRSQLREKLTPYIRHEACADFASEEQCFFLVVPDQKRVDSLCPICSVTSD